MPELAAAKSLAEGDLVLLPPDQVARCVCTCHSSSSTPTEAAADEAEDDEEINYDDVDVEDADNNDDAEEINYDSAQEDDVDREEPYYSDDDEAILDRLREVVAAHEGPNGVVADAGFQPGMRLFHLVNSTIENDHSADALIARAERVLVERGLDAWHIEARIRAAGVYPLAVMVGWRSAWPGRALDQLLEQVLGFTIAPLNLRREEDRTVRLAQQQLGLVCVQIYAHLVGGREAAMLTAGALAAIAEARVAWRLVTAGVRYTQQQQHVLPRPIASMSPAYARMFREQWGRPYAPASDNEFLQRALLPRLVALRPLFFAWLVPRYHNHHAGAANEEGKEAAAEEDIRAHAVRVMDALLPPATFWGTFVMDLQLPRNPPSLPQAGVARDWAFALSQHIECLMEARSHRTAHSVVAFMWSIAITRVINDVLCAVYALQSVATDV